jgi:hypothetical protein
MNNFYDKNVCRRCFSLLYNAGVSEKEILERAASDSALKRFKTADSR